MLSPELETLDQLLSSDLPFSVIAGLYPSLDRCKQGVLGLLHDGDIVLLDAGARELPQWRWRELFSSANFDEQLRTVRVRSTPAGAGKIS